MTNKKKNTKKEEQGMPLIVDLVGGFQLITGVADMKGGFDGLPAYMLINPRGITLEVEVDENGKERVVTLLHTYLPFAAETDEIKKILFKHQIIAVGKPTKGLKEEYEKVINGDSKNSKIIKPSKKILTK